MMFFKLSTGLKTKLTTIRSGGLLLSLLITSWITTAQAELPNLPKTLRTNSSTTKLTLLEFSAPWCVNCQLLKPELQKLQKEAGQKLRVIDLNIDKSTNQKYIQAYAVYATPTLILFDRNGKALQQFDSELNPKDLRKVILNHLTQ